MGIKAELLAKRLRYYGDLFFLSLYRPILFEFLNKTFLKKDKKI